MRLSYSPAQIVKLVTEAYTNSSGVFSEKVNAEDLVPETSTENKIQFLFWVLQMDYSTKSATLYKNANNLWDKNQEWIKPEYLLNQTDDELFTFINQNLKPRYPNEIVKRFKINSESLINNYGGIALNIVKSSDSATNLLSNIRKFRGFGPKLGNFLTRTYIDTLKLDYEDTEEVLPPVDIHDVRLTYEWGFIKDKSMTQKNINDVKKIWSDACKEAGVSWVVFDKALWLIGSEGKRSDEPEADFRESLGLKA